MWWNTGQTVSSGIKISTKITDFSTFSIIIRNISIWADDFNAFVSSSIQTISPNTFQTFTSPFFESITKKIVFNTVSLSINKLSWSAGWIDWNTNSVDWLFSGAETWSTKTISSPFFTFVIDIITSPSDAVEESSSGAGQRCSVTDTIDEGVTNLALSTFGEITVNGTSGRVWNALSILFVLSSGAFSFNTFSVD